MGNVYGLVVAPTAYTRKTYNKSVRHSYAHEYNAWFQRRYNDVRANNIEQTRPRRTCFVCFICTTEPNRFFFRTFRYYRYYNVVFFFVICSVCLALALTTRRARLSKYRRHRTTSEGPFGCPENRVHTPRVPVDRNARPTGSPMRGPLSSVRIRFLREQMRRPVVCPSRKTDFHRQRFGTEDFFYDAKPVPGSKWKNYNRYREKKLQTSIFTSNEVCISLYSIRVKSF